MNYLVNNSLSKDSVVVIDDLMSDLNIVENTQCSFLTVKNVLCADKLNKEGADMVESLGRN